MLNEPTINKLRAWRLEAFAAAWSEQHKSAEMTRLSFERLAILVDAECLARKNKRLTRLLKAPSFASLRRASKTSNTHHAEK
jgi:hypothetical protein